MKKTTLKFFFPFLLKRSRKCLKCIDSHIHSENPTLIANALNSLSSLALRRKTKLITRQSPCCLFTALLLSQSDVSTNLQSSSSSLSSVHYGNTLVVMVVRFITIAFMPHALPGFFFSLFVAVVIIAFATLIINAALLLLLCILHWINILEHERHVQTRVPYACLSPSICQSVQPGKPCQQRVRRFVGEWERKEECEEERVKCSEECWRNERKKSAKPPNGEPNWINSIEAADTVRLMYALVDLMHIIAIVNTAAVGGDEGRGIGIYNKYLYVYITKIATCVCVCVYFRLMCAS